MADVGTLAVFIRESNADRVPRFGFLFTFVVPCSVAREDDVEDAFGDMFPLLVQDGCQVVLVRRDLVKGALRVYFYGWGVVGRWLTS